jgi:hypothetical protein
MRLTEEERSILKVLENALEVSEYTDNVDVYSGFRKRKSQRMIEEVVDFMNISLGLFVATSLVQGEKLVADKKLEDNLPFFRDMFEVGRRYKIMNPGKMRGNYGKMMFLLMDTQSHMLQESMGNLRLDFVKDILTVYSFLEERRCLGLLENSLLDAAAKSIVNTNNEKSPIELGLEKQIKGDAMKELYTQYANGEEGAALTRAELERVVNSVADNNNYLAFNVGPVERIQEILHSHFSVDEEDFSLALSQRGGKKKKKSGYDGFGGYTSYLSGFSNSYSGGGAKLGHTHEEQFKFVQQTFALWHEIMQSMPRLWTLADQDMLSESYSIADTGQGLHRLQQCPRVRKEMDRILRKVQGKFDRWVGLAVVHLGDRDVPNALVFIDKYTQVPNILGPISSAMERLEPMSYDDLAFAEYVKQEWTSNKGLKMQVLSDFFKHGFDGSGDDGGSCIDGRLTSAWNWCSKLEKKPFYRFFSFTGFQGFDGEGFD